CSRRADQIGSQLATFFTARMGYPAGSAPRLYAHCVTEFHGPGKLKAVPQSRFLGVSPSLMVEADRFAMVKEMSDYSPTLNIPVPETFDLLLSRRSGSAKAMTGPGPSAEQLRRILAAGIRVPDHGKLTPWR